MSIGLTQVSESFRNKNLKLHRLLGKIYCVLGIVAVIAAVIMVTEFGFTGRAEAIPTYIFSTLFFITLFKAIYHIWRKEIAVHRRWMVRNFAVVFGIAMIRVYALLFLYLTNLTAREYVTYSFWLGFLTTCGAAEVWIRFGGQNQQKTMSSEARRLSS